jgi:hypothetical protein
MRTEGDDPDLVTLRKQAGSGSQGKEETNYQVSFDHGYYCAWAKSAEPHGR